jgi:glycine C-acetyltransferase
MTPSFKEHLQKTLAEISAAGLGKRERVITSPQGASISVAGGQTVLNFCANNYLGLASHPEVIAAAHAALDRWGYGMASVRFICGTQEIHKELEARLSAFLGTEDTLLYSSCFDANGDGIRLSKAKRYRYRNCDMPDLQAKLTEAKSAGARFKLVVTDGVFSMDGYVAPLRTICEIAERNGAMVMVDDSHGVGFMGPNGRGTPEHFSVMDRVDILTGTLGKALGGAAGGYASGRREIIDLLRQRSRPYLFSNTLPPAIAAASIASLDLITRSPELRQKLISNTAHFREGLAHAGLAIRPGSHPIVPVMLGDAALAQLFAARMLEKGVYVIGFSFPVVPQDAARIRTQVSAAHDTRDLDRAIQAFAETRRELAGWPATRSRSP